MKTLYAAVAVVAAANLIALAGAARNRWGEPDAVVEVLEKEVWLHAGGEDNSGLSCSINWGGYGDPLTGKQIADLGIPLSGDAADRAARILPRVLFVAFERSGPPGNPWRPVEMGRDPSLLRARHPNRSATLIMRALLRFSYAGSGRAVQAWIEQVLPPSINIPPQYREVLTGLTPGLRTLSRLPADPPRFAITIAVGRRYEPYVVGVRRLPLPAK